MFVFVGLRLSCCEMLESVQTHMILYWKVGVGNRNYHHSSVLISQGVGWDEMIAIHSNNNKFYSFPAHAVIYSKSDSRYRIQAIIPTSHVKCQWRCDMPSFFRKMNAFALMTPTSAFQHFSQNFDMLCGSFIPAGFGITILKDPARAYGVGMCEDIFNPIHFCCTPMHGMR